MNEQLTEVVAPASAKPADVAAARPHSSLKLLIVTEDEPFHLAETFAKLLSICPGWLDIAGVAVLKFSPMGVRGSRLALVRAASATFGPGNILRACVAAAGNRLRPARRLTSVLRRFGVKTNVFSALDGVEFARELARLDPDVVVTLAFNRIVPPAVFESGRAVWMNVHLGLLPQNPGPAPVFWALHDGARESGASVHLMTEEVDGGAVLARRVRTIGERRLVAEHRALRLLSVDTLIDALRKLRDGQPRPLHSAKPANWRGTPKGNHVEAFLAGGNRFF